MRLAVTMASFLHVSQERSWFLKSSVSSMCQLAAGHQEGWNKAIRCKLLLGSSGGRGTGISHTTDTDLCLPYR